MLQTKTVEPSTLAVLNRLMQVDELKKFSLVGGTALALMYGHRISVDIDLFSHLPFDNQQIIIALENEFKEDFFLQVNKEKFGIFCFIDSIKIDIIKHPHDLIANTVTIDNIRMYDVKDIAAMKISAILGRGKKKDFWDLYELLKHFSLAEIIGNYFQKFPKQQLAISIPYAITYFDEADESETPICLNNLTWDEVKQNIKKAVREYLK
jgi:predicted nucleotidyltransferase component of viral defense system